MRPIQSMMGCTMGSGGGYGLASTAQHRWPDDTRSTVRSRSEVSSNGVTFDSTAHGVALYRDAVVLFADIVGFTGLAESLPPEITIDFLNRYHSHMAETVYRHGGTVLQYSGDSIMVAFGVPHPGPHNATDALTCGYDMLAAIAHWNARRRLRGRFPIDIGIGIHTGAVVVGEIGIAPHVEQSIAGDTVNVARKLEAMTRKSGTPMIVSVNLVDAVAREGNNDRVLAPLSAAGCREIPGRHTRIPIWVLDRAAVPRATAPAWANRQPLS